MRLQAALLALSAVLLALLQVTESSEAEGWRMADRYAGFRFEAVGKYDKRRFALAIRDRADDYSGFGECSKRGQRAPTSAAMHLASFRLSLSAILIPFRSTVLARCRLGSNSRPRCGQHRRRVPRHEAHCDADETVPAARHGGRAGLLRVDPRLPRHEDQVPLQSLQGAGGQQGDVLRDAAARLQE
jgi:hypothetical protein